VNLEKPTFFNDQFHEIAVNDISVYKDISKNVPKFEKG